MSGSGPGATPDPFGPRNRGQSAPGDPATNPINSTATRVGRAIGGIRRVGVV